MIPLLISCFAIMLASLSGKLLIWKGAGRFIERNLHFMVTFAAGVFLIFSWQLGREVFGHIGVLYGLAWIAGGALAITLFCKLLSHGGASESHGSHAGHSHLDVHRMLISDGIHNIGDGILLAAAFSLGPVVGFAAAASVFLHELVQEIAEFFVLRDAGYSVRRALLVNFATSTPILIGAIGGFIVLELFESLEGPLLAIAMGGVLSVVFFDLIPHSFKDAKARSSYLKHAFWFLLGAFLMFGMISLTPHDHEVFEGASQTSPL
jgi:zinc and cadmium transporter